MADAASSPDYRATIAAHSVGQVVGWAAMGWLGFVVAGRPRCLVLS